ncbi:hypothetical protein LTR86_005963 [Recurvomyces mirabilis]|nr:hypothetical protein LTR86_005963 [Recurvomyces mirabilis]
MQRTMTADHQVEITESVTDLSATAWPGERHPTRYDVDEATEIPESSFVDRFAAALLHAEHGDNREDVSWIMEGCANEPSRPAATLTYPMILLSDAPKLSAEDEIDRLASGFDNSWRNHVILRSIKIGWTPTSSSLPYLRLALACLTALSENRNDGKGSASLVAGNLFHCGASLATVMVEVDNRLARSIDTIIAVHNVTLHVRLPISKLESMEAKYGSSVQCHHGESTKRDTSCILRRLRLTRSHQMSRRLHLTDSRSLICMANGDPRKVLRHDSSLISYMLLIDVVQAIHFDFVPNYSPQELFIQMPGSLHTFHKVYKSLLDGCALPADLTFREDALLLLVALLGDVIRAQKTGSLPSAIHESLSNQNPYAPMTVHWETSRLEATLESALTRWRSHFTQTSHDVLALYHFARLHLIFPQTCKLARWAGYPDRMSKASSTTGLAISTEAADLAWEVLAESEACPTGSESYMSIWLPVVVFYSALVVGREFQNKGQSKTNLSSARILGSFKEELQRLGWPCCAAMIATIVRA